PDENTSPGRPPVDPRDVTPTKRDDIKHIKDTWLPPGISEDAATDPGGKTPEANPEYRDES
ncbi:MAG TPA: hypothetical protein VGC80_18110, partial [Acetobacteraceae bacterium]